ncbi:hypothetical protein T552_01458 [Pneumocystis carinii B80]|uniref:Lariat debranching enzyme C-terminal domain-containing protein n=1 Tax=Pneumocystis carinii (strain B80) TaxID=1408658 RepID=A0A0W4ZKC8_PNEC8|nr:hypothetical protein T552_01458 [Pneumocystis carinii B80]KTW28829.1 hypothetical protein T552_01458 [Pneumocystis carinii B80]
MKIAVEGCCHSELDKIYKELKRQEEKTQSQVDVLLIAGDFQAVRNEADLECLSVPKKYRKLGDFSSYYSGEKKAPVLTIFIGGNHEASNYLWELYYGGWVCPNIYYMGAANIINISGLRIAGLSGIYKEKDYKKGHFEKVPYNIASLKSVYHVREFEVCKLLNTARTRPIDIFLSHDWPRGIERYGDLKRLLSIKPYFFEDIQNNCLGSAANERLMNELQPAYWFAAHMHVKFEAIKIHNANENCKENPDEIDLNEEGEEDEAITKIEKPHKATRFLALDKCIPGRHFLEILDIPTPLETNEKPILSYDVDWLAICRVFHSYFSIEYQQPSLPWDNVYLEKEIEKEKKWVYDHIAQSYGLEIPQHFEHTAPTAGNAFLEHPRMKISLVFGIDSCSI